MEQLSTKPSKTNHPLKYRGTKCLNCDHDLDISDRYCPNCSQINSTKKTTLKDFVREFFDSVISYDSKLFKTLTAMLLHPGRISKEYIQGKRVSYTNPFRFLLSLTILYFLLVNFTQDFSSLDDRVGAIMESDEFVTNNTDPLDAGQQAMKVIDSLKLVQATSKLSGTKDSLILANPETYFKSLDTLTNFQGFYLKTEFFVTLIKNKRAKNFKQVQREYNIPSNYINRKSFALGKSFLRAIEQPGTFLSTLISKLPFVIFFFLPVFALFVWLMYIRNKYNYVEHLIFSFQIQSLFFILLLISFFIDAIFKTQSEWVFILIFSVYLYKAMRNFYGQGRFKTFVKYLILNTLFFILAAFSIVILFTGTIYTY